MNVNFTDVHSNLKQAFECLFLYATYEIGFFQNVWRQSLEQKGSDFYSKVVQGIIGEVNQIADQGQEGIGTQCLDLIILLIDALIFNLYSKNKSVDRAKIHQQVYMTSQMSAMQSKNVMESMNNQYIVFEVKAFVKSIETLAVSQDFFDSIDLLLQYNDCDANKLQLTHFITSLEYILEKEQVSDQVIEGYIHNKGKIARFLIERQKMAEQEEIDEVNKLIFSKKLTALKKLFYVKDDSMNVKELHFTIGRIYFAAYSKRRSNYKRRQFKTLEFQGEDMIHNIFRLYIQTQTKRDQLFKEQEENDPLLDFILNYLLLLYTPVYLGFQQLFEDLLMPAVKLPPPKFFPAVQQAIENQIIPFFNELPSDFLNLFAQFNQIIQDANHFTDALPSIFAVKNLLLPKFLLNPHIKEAYIKHDYNMENYLTVANLFKDLFYTVPNRSYSNLPQFIQLSVKMKQVIETYLTTYDYDQYVDVYSYFITDPLLRNDYSYLYTYLQQVKILPSDLKDYNMETFQCYFPKRVYYKPTDNLEEVQAIQQKEEQKKLDQQFKQMQADLEGGGEKQDKKDDDEFSDEFEKQKQKQDDSPKFMESMIILEKIEKATQTEIQDDDDLKKVDTFKPNFNENSLLNDDSITPLNNELHVSRQQVVALPSEPELYEKKILQFNQNDVHQNDEEIYELKNKIDDIQSQHEELIAKLKFDHQQQFKEMEYQNAQLLLKNNQLENEQKLIFLDNKQKDEIIEQLYNDKLQLQYDNSKLFDEKECQQKILDMYTTIKVQPEQQSMKQMMEEFDDLNNQLGERQKQLMTMTSQNEIQRRKYLK